MKSFTLILTFSIIAAFSHATPALVARPQPQMNQYYMLNHAQQQVNKFYILILIFTLKYNMLNHTLLLRHQYRRNKKNG